MIAVGVTRCTCLTHAQARECTCSQNGISHMAKSAGLSAMLRIRTRQPNTPMMSATIRPQTRREISTMAELS